MLSVFFIDTVFSAAVLVGTGAKTGPRDSQGKSEFKKTAFGLYSSVSVAA